MRAAVIEGGTFAVTEVPDPTPGPGDLVLKVLAVGVCGSDVKTAGYMPDGTIMGHELVGEVVAIGSDVTSWRLGTVAVSLPAVGCGQCPSCLVGDVARCVVADPIGVGGRAGAYAELIRVSARESWPFLGPDPRLGALVEPLAVGLHAVNRAGLTPDDSLLVIGAGPVGLTVATWAQRLGVASITVSDPSAGRRTAAAELGATRTIDPSTEELGGSYDVVVECVGAVGMVSQVIDALGHRGRGVIAGVCLEQDPFMPVVAVMKDVDLRFVSYYTTSEFATAGRLLGSGQIDYGSFVTATRGLDDLADTVAELKSPTDQRKVLIVP